MSLIRWLFINF